MELPSRPLFYASFLFLSLYSAVIPVYSRTTSNNVHVFQQSSNDAPDLFLQSEQFRKKRYADVTETESEKTDSKCEAQQQYFSNRRDQLKNGSRLEETHTFVNESKFNVALAWAGQNDDGVLLVLSSTDLSFLVQPESTLWRSKDHGRTWVDLSKLVDNKVFRKDDGLQRNRHNPRKVYLVSYEHFMYVTEDGGETWHKTSLTSNELNSASVDEELEFHPDPECEDYVAVISDERQLYVTYNNFLTDAIPIKSGVHTVKWGTSKMNQQKSLYATTGDFTNPLFHVGPEMLTLERYDSETQTWKVILKRVFVFNVEGKFIYASIFKSENPKTEEDEKIMMISSDGGETFGEAQLPTVTGDRFFSVVEMTDDLIFMHVDNPGDTGHGILYTSSSSGLVYAISLKNHLFPNYNVIHDFRKVLSIRGVYLASQIDDDKSIHTVITYNRGAEWKQVPRPVGVPCQSDEKKDRCSLQIHSSYSLHRGIKAQLPHSQKEAYGLVLVHAHVASNLQTTPPDVYLSTDGGYNFKRVLKGPHAYEIADSGGLLVAVPLETDFPKIIKFSTDEGNCWHIYKFTSEEIRFTGLLTEPGGKSMTVSLWGYHNKTKKWTVSVIDFNTVVTRECKEEDYISWTPHTGLNTRPGYEGCLLGKKETFKRIRQDSWCRNGYYKNMEIVTETCKCTEEDYECDYGFYRPINSTKCIRQQEIKAEQIDICKDGHFEKLKTFGYRLIPGDTCDTVNGFHPVSDMTALPASCQNGDKSAFTHDITPTEENTGSVKWIVASIVIIILVLISAVGAFLMYRMALLRRNKVVYRYSKLNSADSEIEKALNTHDSLFNESSDEEIEQRNVQPRQNGTVPSKMTTVPSKMTTVPSKLPAVPVKSYHDDSDDDMLG